jgi:plasmid stability protein
MADLEIHDVPEDVMARLRLRAQRNHTTVEGFAKYLLEQDSKRITVEEAVERSRENSRGSGVTADDVLAAIEESRAHRP